MSIRPRGRGYEVRVSARDPITGKRKWLGGMVRTKTEAKKLHAELETQVDKGVVADAGRLTVFAYETETWLPFHETRVRPGTYRRDEELLRLHVLPVLGNVKLSAVRPLHVQRVMDVSKGRVAPGTQNLVYRALKSSLEQAVRWQLLAVNPARGVLPPRVERATLNVPNTETIGRIRRGLWIEQPVTLAIATGMRLGEVLGLRWRDTDLDGGEIHVTQAVEWSGREYTFTQPKTDESRREISLPPFAIHEMRQWRRDQAERRLLLGTAWHDHDLVIDGGDGRPHRTDSVSAAFRALMKRSGIEPRPRFHDLRHGYASALLIANIHPKVVSEALGHASVAFTLDIYSSVIPSMGKQAADAIEHALGGS